MNIKVEICCGSYLDAYNAFKGKATRIELNSALHLGGLTPTVGSLILSKKLNLEVTCMLRNRAGGFCYNDIEFEQMLVDAKILLENKADAIAFGCLNKDHTINTSQTKILIDLIHSYNAKAVFHRAIDCTYNQEEEIKKLIDLKIDRVLTSGSKSQAIKSLDKLKLLQDKFKDKVELVCASGINSTNAHTIISHTNITSIHSSCKDWMIDSTSKLNDVNFDYDIKRSLKFDVVSNEIVKNLIDSIK